jgi:alanine dehydrogenase
MPKNCKVIYSTPLAVRDALPWADLVVGAVLIPGAAAPKLGRREDLATMKPGSVIVDVAVDQGGCCETTRPTTHATPTFLEHGVVHYCDANMPGGVARTSTFAHNNATMPYVIALADKGWRKALADDVHLRHGLNVCRGRVTFEAVARDLALDFTPAENFLAEAA